MATNYNLDEITLDSEQEVSTDTPQESEIQPSSTEGENTGGIRGMEQVYADRAEAGQPVNRPGVTGFVQDTLEGTARNMYENAAPLVGITDTFIDTLNWLVDPEDAIPGDGLPKLPAYESNVYTALRNISGLVVPSLGLRSMMLTSGAKLRAAGGAAPWLQKLGNR